MKKEILKLENVCLTYHSKNGETEALKNINFVVENGEFVAILGPSGCGKTTILSLISGVLKPTSGKVILNGKLVEKCDSSTGYMFQKDQLFEWRSVLQNVCLGLEIQKQKTTENIEKAKALLKKYGLNEFENKFPNQLSGGMRQRVALFRTLTLNPHLLLLDEPFSALDYQSRLNLCDDVHSIIKNEKKTAVLVTHDISEAISLADKIIVLTKRPATIKTIVDVGSLKDINSPLKRRESPLFKDIFQKIWTLLQEG